MYNYCFIVNISNKVECPIKVNFRHKCPIRCKFNYLLFSAYCQIK